MTTENKNASTQGNSAYDRLHAAIRDGAFPPGARIRESDVAKRLGLSRTPVREALRRLESDGLIEHSPRSGAVVRSLSRSEIVELYEMRIVLERAAAELAARHASEAEIDEIEALNAEIAKARNAAAAAARFNADFHRALCLAARNRFLREAIRALHNALMLLGPTTLDSEERMSAACAQHAEIVAAIRNHDADAAGMAARIHMETALRHRLRAMRE